MSVFDPTRPALVYDEMNDTFLKWRPEWAIRDRTIFQRPALSNNTSVVWLLSVTERKRPLQINCWRLRG